MVIDVVKFAITVVVPFDLSTTVKFWLPSFKPTPNPNPSDKPVTNKKLTVLTPMTNGNGCQGVHGAIIGTIV